MHTNTPLSSTPLSTHEVLDWRLASLKVPTRTNEFGQPLLDDYGVDIPDLIADLIEQDGTDALDERLVTDLLGVTVMPERITVARPASGYTPIVALLDPKAPAKLVPTVGVPEFDFEEHGFAWWIGEHGSVGCAVGMVPSAGAIAENGGWHARHGTYPSMCGFVVNPFRPDFHHPAACQSRYGDAYSLWRVVQDTLLTLTEEQESE